MYLVVGLGNPGKQYEATRHNMGFDTVDRLVEDYNVPQGGVDVTDSVIEKMK
jgi:PTH1 family peptidyl-tRNA hydrolase